MNFVIINTKKIILLLTLVSYSFTGLCQQQGRKPLVINYSKREYKAENQNWSITSTADGVQYIANNSGLLEFDGSNWNIYKMPDGLTIRSVAHDNTGKIYVGSYEEFGYWKADNTNRKSYVSLSDSLDDQCFHNDEIWRIIPCRDVVYFQSFNSIYSYDSTGVHALSVKGPFVLMSRARNRLFIQKTGQGLFEFREDSLHSIPGSHIFQEDEIKFVLPFREDEFLIGASEMGLYVWDEKSFEPWITEERELFNASELNNAIRINEHIIVGTIVDGIFIFDQSGALVYHLHTANYLQNNTVLSLYAGEDGNFWAGLDRGIDYVNMNSPLDFYVYPKVTVGSVYAAAQFNNKLWIGTNQGLFTFDYNPSKGFYNQQLIPGTQGQIWEIKEADDQLIIGHNNGTFHVGQNGRISRISEVSGGYDFKKFFHNDQKLAIQSTYSNLVLYRFENGSWRYLRTIKDFIEPVAHIELDHLGYLWGKHAHKGIVRMKLDEQYSRVTEIKYYGKQQGLPGKRTVNLAKINERVVFSTQEKLYTYDDIRDLVIPYSALNNTLGPYRGARKIINAGEHKYWFLKDNNVGLFCIKENKVEKIFTFNLYRQGVSLLSRHPEVVPLHDSLHLICLDNGFALYDEGAKLNENPNSKVQLRKIFVYNKTGEKKYLPLNDNLKQEIPYGFRNIHLEFSSAEITPRAAYRYKLNGLQERYTDWSEVSTTTFTRLPYGDYTFEVQTKNIYGEASQQTTWSFTIAPPFYLSTRAILVYIVLFIVVIYLLRIGFLRRVRQHAVEVEQSEKEKRRREQMLLEQQYMQVKNRDLQSEIASKSIELANYTMTIIHKNEVLLRIKEELQTLKNQLGPRFPNYYYKKLIKILERNLSSEDEWNTFQSHFDRAHENFFRRLKAEYPELTPNDLKLCAYLRMNLSTKEIAPLLNISVRGVEVRRYRLRKRLQLNRQDNLVEFLLGF